MPNLDTWYSPEAIRFIGGLVLFCLYLWLLTKFEKKKTREDLEKEKKEREEEFTSLWNAHILSNAEKRASEIEAVGTGHFVLRKSYHAAMNSIDGKLHRVMLDQIEQGANLKNLHDQLSGIVQAIGTTNTTLSKICTDVAVMSGIWSEHVRTHGGLSLSNPQQRNT